jgi:hypothetical protein
MGSQQLNRHFLFSLVAFKSSIIFMTDIDRRSENSGINTEICTC